MSIIIYSELEQGTDEWLEARRGILTASEVKLVLTPSLKVAKNDKVRAHMWDLAAQNISGFVEPSFISDDMLRGITDEVRALEYYESRYEATQPCGFITNDKWGFTIGYSPDALVGDEGLIECKSRRQKFQIETIVKDEVPQEYMLQIQTALMVSERQWIDFVSFCGGLPMYVKRVYPDNNIQETILTAAKDFYEQVDDIKMQYFVRLKDIAEQLTPTERAEPEQEIIV